MGNLGRALASYSRLRHQGLPHRRALRRRPGLVGERRRRRRDPAAWPSSTSLVRDDPIAIGVIATPADGGAGRRATRLVGAGRRARSSTSRPAVLDGARRRRRSAGSTSRPSCRSSPSTSSAAPASSTCRPPRSTVVAREPARHRTVAPHAPRSPCSRRSPSARPGRRDRHRAASSSAHGHRGRRALDLQPRSRSMPRCRPSTRPSRPSARRSPRCRHPSRRGRPRRPTTCPTAPRCTPTTSTCATTTAPSPTPSPSPAGSTRWPSARPRSSARCATRSPWPSAAGSVGESLNSLFQQALRVGKRAHTETDIDRHSVSLVAHRPGAGRRASSATSTGCSAAVVGAGGMSGLAAATVSRAGVGVAHDRQPHGRARRAARRAARWDGAARGPSCADVLAERPRHHLHGCRRARHHRARLSRAAPGCAAAARRSSSTSPCRATWTPPSTEPRSRRHAHRPRSELGDALEGRADACRGPRVGELVTGEVAAYLTRRLPRRPSPRPSPPCAPAPRASSTAEMDRLDRRAADLDEPTGPRWQRAVHRIVEKLLHTPTVRVKEFAHGRAAAADYAAALRELFDLEPARLSATSSSPAPTTRRSPMTILRLGTRRSALATTQSRWVADRLRALGHEVELVEITTEGDRSRRAARRPSAAPASSSRPSARRCTTAASTSPCTRSRTCRPRPRTSSCVAAIPVREDSRDVLVARDGLTLGELPVGSVVGTGSPRRARPARRARPRPRACGRSAATSTPASGFVTTGALDAVVLARAGLRPPRSPRRGHRGPRPDPGAPGARARARSPSSAAPTAADVIAAVAALDDADTRTCVTAERAAPRRRSRPGCTAPVGALAEVVEGDDGLELSLRAFVGSEDGSVELRRSARRRLHRAGGPRGPASPRSSSRTAPPTSPPPGPPPRPQTAPHTVRSVSRDAPPAVRVDGVDHLGPTTPARVAFVGSGPGDPGLLTLRGRDLIAAADAVILDRVHERGRRATARPPRRRGHRRRPRRARPGADPGRRAPSSSSRPPSPSPVAASSCASWTATRRPSTGSSRRSAPAARPASPSTSSPASQP